jgi:beta-lactamase class A
MLKKYRNIIIPVLCVGAGVFLGSLFFGGKVMDRSDCVNKLSLLKKNIDCEVNDEKLQKLSSIESALSILAEGYKKTGKVKRVSVFIRDLNTSRFAGYKDTETYYMASLLKTPLVIGGFKLAEVEPKILEQVMQYNGVPNLYGNQVVRSTDVLQVGQLYTIKDLMRRSVVYSDNTAAQILFDYFPEEFLSKIMQALGISITRPDGEVENYITARTYANMFRVLYNASYLTKEYSNETLDLLTQTEFKDAATSKLPKDVKVAHKFGERTLVYDDGRVAIKQFHECGIVYAKGGDEPYIFCILTEGNDYEDLKQVIAEISLKIYEEIIND